jgi:hypothetical protein
MCCRCEFGKCGRIFDGYSNGSPINWLSGHWNSFNSQKAGGVVFHNNVLKNPVDTTQTAAPWVAWAEIDTVGYDWTLSADQWDYFRSDRAREYFNGGEWTNPLQITINDGSMVGTETSDWGVAVVLLYNRILSATEIATVGGHPCGHVLLNCQDVPA